MKSVRRIATVVWLALALLVAQQAAALHDLGHATGQLTHKHDSKTPASKCDKCFACAELSGAVGVGPLTLPTLDATHAQLARRTEGGVVASLHLAFRSRAPPAFPV